MRVHPLVFVVLSLTTPIAFGAETVQQSQPIAAVTAQGTLEFDAVPNQNNINVEVGVSETKPVMIDELAAVVRFNPAGFLDVRNRTYYASAIPVSYAAGNLIHVQMILDLVTKRYTVWVKGGSATVNTRIAPNIPYRSTRALINSVSAFSVISVTGAVQIKNLSLNGKAIPDYSPLAGLTFTQEQLARAKNRISTKQVPFAASCSVLTNLSTRAISPFHMTAPFNTIKYGWCGADNDNVDNSVSELRDKSSKDMATVLSGAARFVLLADAAAGSRAVSALVRWNDEATLPTMYDLKVDFKNSKFDGSTDDGLCGVRPWNMALDLGWVTYGLKGAASAYAMLKKNNYPLTALEDQKIQSLIRKMAATVNSSLRAWTEWARLHPGGSSSVRYASDNHVGIYLSGLAAAAAALQDTALMEYVINGTAYDFGNGDNLANFVPLKTYLQNALVLDAPTNTVALADIGWKTNYRTYMNLSLISLGHMFRVIDLNYEKETGLRTLFKTTNGYTPEMAFETFAHYITGDLGGGSADVMANIDPITLEYPYMEAKAGPSKDLYKKALGTATAPPRIPRSTTSFEHDTSSCLIGADD